VEKNRDFVDFVIDLIKLKKVFAVVFILVFTMAYFYQIKVNNQYKFTENITISSQSAYIEILEFLNTIKKHPEGLIDKQFVEYVPWETAATKTCELIRNTIYREAFRTIMTDKYLSSFETNLTRKNISDNIVSSIKNKKSKSGCTTFTITGDMVYVDFMKANFMPTLFTYLDEEIVGTYTKLRMVKQRVLNQTYNFMLENNIDDSLEVMNKINLLNSFDLGKGNVPYFEYNESKITKQMPTLFVIAFAVFITIIVFITSAIIIDFKRQFIAKSKE